jgi:RNA polymerase sigma-70 factor (ECF subfamily)
MEGRRRLEELIGSERATLLKTLRFYVFRAGLASGRDADAMAEDLLNEAVVEAFRSAHRLKPDIHPHPWLLGIAVNLIKRKRVEIAKRERREPLMRDLLPDTQGALSDDELFDQLPEVSAGMLDSVEVKQEIDQLLACVSSSDGDLLRLALAHDLNGEALAKALHITPGAARVRLHRALNRLRSALVQQRDTNDV